MLTGNLFKYWTYQAFSPGTVLREKYEAFKLLLENDKCAHEVMAELEEIYHNQIKVDFKLIEAKYDQFSTCVLKIVENLNKMRPTRYQSLKEFFQKFDALPDVFQGIGNSQKRCDCRGLGQVKIYPAAGFRHD